MDKFSWFLRHGQNKVCVADLKSRTCTSAVTITNTGQVSSVRRQGILTPETSTFPSFEATVPTGPYTLKLFAQDTGELIRQWSGVGPYLSIAWDGKTSFGQPAEEGQYYGSVYPYSGEATTNEGAVWMPLKVCEQPLFVAAMCIQTRTNEGAVVCSNVKRAVKAALESINTFNNVPFVVFGYTEHMDPPEDVWEALKHWLNVADYFYFNGHGVEDFSDDGHNLHEHSVLFGGAHYIYNYYPGRLSPQDLMISGLARFNPLSPEFRGGFKFVWMDACDTAGSCENGPVHFMSNDLANLWGWKEAFGINLSQGGSIMCTNGHDYMSYGGSTEETMHENEWGRFRRKFWWSMGSFNTVSDSCLYGALHSAPFDSDMHPRSTTFLNAPYANLEGDYFKLDLRGGTTILGDEP